MAVKSTGARLRSRRLALPLGQPQNFIAVHEIYTSAMKKGRTPREQGAALYFTQPQKFLLSKELWGDGENDGRPPPNGAARPILSVVPQILSSSIELIRR